MCEKEKLFLELVNGFRWAYDLEKYPRSLFGFKNEEILFQIFNINEEINHRKIIYSYRFSLKQDLKHAIIWINYDKIWSIFESKFEMKYDDIQFFMKDMAEKHFKISIGINVQEAIYPIHDVDSYFKISLHKHFKRKIVN